MSITKEKLDELRKLAILTGKLSEVHVNTMKNSPFVFFDNLNKVEITHDISPDSFIGSRVQYTLSFDDDTHIEDSLLSKRVLALKNTVKAVLWDEVVVTVLDQKGRLLE